MQGHTQKIIVGSKYINETVMDTNLEKLGINQKQKEKIKAATAKTNIHSLLNILKAYYANTHQDSPKATSNEGAETLQLTIDTRQILDKLPPHINRDLSEPHTSPPTPEKRHGKRPSSRHEGDYTSLMPQVNYTEGPSLDNPPRPVRKLLQSPTRPTPKRLTRDHSEQPPHSATGPHSPKKARTDAPRPLDSIPQTHTSLNPLTFNGAPHTRKRPPEDNPHSFSKKQKTVDTSGNGE
jgi:hypothetical protein